ncbi:MAG: YfhO family protein [Candidatus Levybacteria bacterium]|nr:YfhO family protein [Candidatus Levybacteria bacterium]
MKYVKRFFPVIFLVFLILIVFWPVFTGGTFISTGLIYSDLMPFNYPLKDLYRDFLMSGKLPFWTNLMGSGYPIFAEGQMGALYPFHLILFRLFPTLAAFNLNIFLHFLIAAFSTFAFCRISLKLSKYASILAGIAYVLSGFYLTRFHQINIDLVISYLPLVFLLTERLVTTKKSVFAFFLSIVFAFEILAGHIEMFYYVSLASVLYFIIITFIFPQNSSSQKKINLLILFASSFIIGALIAAPQLLATMELVKFSQRSGGLSLESSGGSVWPLESLWLFLNPRSFNIYLPTPDFHPLNPDSINFNVVYGYVGIIPFLFALMSIITSASWRIRKRNVLIFAFFLIGAFIFGLGQSTQLFTILWNIVPGLKFFREPVKILFLVEFSLIILAALGFDQILKILEKRKVHSKKIFIFSIVIIFIIFFDLYLNSVRVILPVIPASPWFTKPQSVSFLEKELNNSDFRIHSCGVGNLDYSLTRDYKIQKDLQNVLPPNFNLLYKIPSSQEWVVLFFKPMIDLNQESLSFNSKGIFASKKTKKALELQNVRFIVCTLPIQDSDFILKKKIPLSHKINHYMFVQTSQGNQRNAIPTDSIYIYEYKKYTPRAFFVSDIKVIKNREEILKTVLDESFNPLERVILEEMSTSDISNVFKESKLSFWNGNDHDRIPLNSQRDPIEAYQPLQDDKKFNNETLQTKSKIEIVKDIGNELVIKAKTDKSGILVLADNYYPGWSAEIDGKETKIYRANYTFRAIKLDKGEHLIKFTYEPTHWRVGFAISGIALIVVLFGLGYSLIKKK